MLFKGYDNIEDMSEVSSLEEEGDLKQPSGWNTDFGVRITHV